MAYLNERYQVTQSAFTLQKPVNPLQPKIASQSWQLMQTIPTNNPGNSQIGPNQWQNKKIKNQKINSQKPFLKDLPSIQGANPSSGGGPTNIINLVDGYLQHTDNDLEMLADFEEE